MADKDVEEGKACAILAYLLVGIIWYFVDDKMKKNRFARFHAQQGLVLLVAGFCFSVAYGIVFAILTFPLRFIPILGWMIIAVLSLVFWLPFIFAIIGIVHAVQGSERQLPIIGRYGEKLKI